MSPARGGARSLLLVHGAGSGPWVFDRWPAHFPPALHLETVDLQDGLDAAHASMAQYADAVARAAQRLEHPVVVVAWSMGGLAAMMAADSADALVLLEASAPAEVQGVHRDVRPAPGVFDPEAEYGAFPDGVRARPESSLARAERKRGISVPEIACPVLVVYGDEFADERGRRLVERYGAREVALPGKSHWDLVRDPDAIRAVAGAIAALL
ncbi:MAG TPA: alpha/beta fold hydrolase [Methylomirabilota bacterium]|nr:alpha/beta fold hydrolase [Methylomirabilota bacterium]